MAKAIVVNRPRYKFQYGVKFICTSTIPGTVQTTDAFLPGSYQTAVNFHTPQKTKIKMRKKISSPISVFNFLEDSLEPDDAGRVICLAERKKLVKPWLSVRFMID